MTDLAPDWDCIRHRYEETQDTVATICREAGIDLRTLASRRKKEGWRRKNPRPFPPLRKSAPSAADARLPASDATAPTMGGEALSEPGAGETHLARDAEVSVAAIPRRLLATPASRRRLVERLTAAIALKLEQLERRMSKDLTAGDDSSATDHERETRTIGALIDNLEKIRELEAGLGKSTGGNRAATPATDLADEADRCRRELAQRLARLVEAAGH